ncbi:MAG: cation:proton antiporter [Thermaerobacter sp.]|nr:cation:proton antiporter [Thermaerobacter sp.]
MAGSSWYPMVLLLLLALAVPLLLSRVRRWRIPVVVGELFAGMIFGRTGFGIIPETRILAFLSLFGLSYLMFLSGLELDLGLFLGAGKVGKRRAWVALSIYLGVLLLSLGATQLLSALGMHTQPIVGFIIGSTALTVTVPVLKERGVLQTAFGQSVLATAVLLDFLSMLLVTVDIGIRSGTAPRLMLGLALFALAAVLLRFAPSLRRLWQRAESEAAQVGVRGAFALIVLFLALSQLIGIQAVLGSFLAGVIAAAIAGQESDQLRTTLDGIGYGFFIPVFFILVGAGLNMRLFLAQPSSMLLALALFVLASAASLLPGLLLRFVMPWRAATSGAFLLTTRLTVTIAGATVAEQAHAISQGTMTAIVLMSIATSLVWPAIAQRFMPHAAAKRHGVIVRGGSAWSALAAAHLRERGERVVWLGEPAEAPPGVEGAKVEVNLERSLRMAGAEQAAALLALGEDPAENAALCRIAHTAFAVPRVVALAPPEESESLAQEGIGCFAPDRAPVLVLEAMARAPLVLEMLSGGVAGAQVASLHVHSPQTAGRTLAQLALPRELLIIGLERAGQRIVPRGATRLELGDDLTALGPQELIERLARQIGDEQMAAKSDAGTARTPDLA